MAIRGWNSARKAVFVSSHGSTGDIALLSRIAQAFCLRGYSVRFLLPEFYLERTGRVLRSMGLMAAALCPAGFDLTWDQIRIQVVDAYVRLITAPEHIDFIVGDASCMGLMQMARGAGIPFFQATMMPFVPTRSFMMADPHPMYRKLGWYNAMRWNRVQKQASHHHTVNTLELLEQHAPALAKKWAEIVGRDQIKAEILDRYYRDEVQHLMSVNPAILPRPRDWGANVHCLPYTQWDPSTLEPSPELERFVASGKPPVFVGFGSHSNIRFSGPDGKRLLMEMAEAAARIGERIVFQAAGTVWDEAVRGNDPPPPNTFCAQDVSHRWLFPRCSVVVCHGGYGTMHNALKAHKPLIVYPWITDQFLWATRLEQLGVAAPYRTLYRDLSAAAFARDLLWIRSHPEATRRAGKLGRILAAEDDPVPHVTTIERIVGEAGAGD